MAKLFCVKNPKTQNCMLDFPFVEVKSTKADQMGSFPTIGYLVQCTEYSHNRYGGTNGWEIGYFLPLQEGYEFISKEDRLLNLYNQAEDIKKAKTIFSGKRDGVEDQFVLVKDKTTLENFILHPVSANWHFHMRKILPLLKGIHRWDGKPSQMTLRGEYMPDRDSYITAYISDESQSKFLIFSHEDGEKRVYHLWIDGEFQGEIPLEMGEYEIANFVKKASPEDCENRPFVDEDERPRRLRRRRPRPEDEAPAEE